MLLVLDQYIDLDELSGLLDGQSPGRGEHRDVEYPNRHPAMGPSAQCLDAGQSRNLFVIRVRTEARGQGDHLRTVW